MIFLGFAARARLGSSVLFAEAVSRTFSLELGGYPRWLVVLAGTLALVLGLWIFLKVLKVALWLVLVVVLFGGVAWAGWVWLH